MDYPTGLCFLFVGQYPEKGYEAFNEIVRTGARGLCLTRNNPDHIRQRHGLTCPIVWLARSEEAKDLHQAIHPEHILKIHTAVMEFLKHEGPSAIMLDGLEYLITQNDFNSVLKLLALINERVALARARIIIPINPAALEPKQLGLLERECHRVDVKANSPL